MASTPSTVFIVCTKLTSNLNWEGEVDIVSVHPTLKTANNAARRVRDEYFEAYSDEFDRDLEDVECPQDERFSDEFVHNDSYGERWEVYVEERPFSGSITTPVKARSSYGPVVTIPVGQRLLRGAQILLTGSLESMDRGTAHAAVDIYGGRVVYNAAEADYVVIGSDPHTHVIQTASTFGAEKVNEGALYTLLRYGVPKSKVLKSERLQELSSNVSTPARKTSCRRDLVARPDGIENSYGPPSKRMRV